MPVRDLLSAASGASAPSDPYFEYNTLLLNGDGTNGAQNNTFLDSSTNNFTITRNGNTTQGSFSPYNNLWSNYFGGSGNYMYPPTNSAFNVGNSGTPFTFECWVYPVGSGNFFAVGNGAAYGNAIACQWDGTYFRFSQGDGAYPPGSNYSLQSSSTYAANQWYHFAIVRNSSNVLTMYINGVSQASGTNTSGVASATQAVINGAYDNNGLGSSGGTYFISNLRFVSGTAVYTSAFTPSTTPLTAISGTVLLTCQSNRFKDNSSNNYSFTFGGSQSVQRFSPFNPTAPYDTATIGGSGYFDGSGDYLKTTGTVGIANSAFTICCWFYPLTTSVVGLFDSGPGVGNVFRNYPSNNIENQGGTAVSFASGYKVNAWNWMCVTKSGTSFTIYINGVSIVTGTCNSTMVESNFTVGAINDGSAGVFNGYISDFQVLNSSTNVSVPSAPITNASGKTYLLSFTNAGIPDLAMQNDLETVGNAQVSTSVKKYGTGSLAFDGTGDYLKLSSNPQLATNTGDMTLEMWIYPASTTSLQTFFDSWLGSGNGFYLWMDYWSGGYAAIDLLKNDTTYYYNSNSPNIALNTWSHLALTRSSNTVRLFVNGIQQWSTTVTDSWTNQTAWVGWGTGNGNIAFNGYIDDLRITKGLARYTANFTPPTSALPTY